VLHGQQWQSFEFRATKRITVCFILTRNKESKERVREQPLLLVLLSRTVVVVTYCCCCLLLFFFSISFNTHISFLFDCCFNLQMSSPSKSPTKKKQRPAARPPPPPAARPPPPPAARPPPPVARPLLPPAGRPLLPPAGRPLLPLNQPVYCQPVPFVPNFARSNPSLPYFPPPMSPWVMNQYSLHAEPVKMKADFFFNISPFGIYCRTCTECPIGCSRRAIERHISCHHKGFLLCDPVEFLAHVPLEISRLKNSCDIGVFIECEVDGFICECGSAFAKKVELERHCKGKRCTCNPGKAQAATIYKTKCGRQISYLDTLLASEEDDAKDKAHPSFDFRHTESLLTNLLRPDETVGPYVAVFHPIIQKSGGKLESIIVHMIESGYIEPQDNENGLKRMISAAESWIYTFARRLVEMTPGNIRAALQVFDGQLVGEVSQNFLASFVLSVRCQEAADVRDALSLCVDTESSTATVTATTISPYTTITDSTTPAAPVDNAGNSHATTGSL
jgi:hypothetical protein